MRGKDEVEAEQDYIDRAYQRLDELRGGVNERTASVLREKRGGARQAKIQREAFLKAGSRRLAGLNVGDQPLVFGRLDGTDGSVFYIGRSAINDLSQDPIVVDWRARVAEAFYRATPSEPMDILRRRHFICRGQRLLRIDDELMDSARPPKSLVLMGEAALLYGIQRGRTGRMRDVVATIQSEQDRIIRAPLEGIHVVQGGPGTGKTVVALHRAAFLSFTHHRRLSGSGILVVGPNSVFLRYIEDVLPSLGEDQVRLSTPGKLVDGAVSTRSDPRGIAKVKGEIAMVNVIAQAIADHEQALAAPISIWHDSVPVTLAPEASLEAVRATRAAGLFHNPARVLLEKAIIHSLHTRFQKALREEIRSGVRGDDPVTNDMELNLSTFGEAVRDHSKVRNAIDQMWPILDARSLLEEILQRKGLDRDDELENRGLSDADVALIDEIQSQLGPAPTASSHEQEFVTTDSKEEAVRQVLDDLSGFMVLDEFMLADVARVVERNYDDEFDATDRQPRQREEFGHVLIDEAQELSPMQWRMIARRCPSGSMTIVGDLGQASAPWVPSSWSEVLEILPKGRPSTVMELSINYRTPAEVMEFASSLLEDNELQITQPRSVRSNGFPPVVRETNLDGMSAALKALCDEASVAAGEGNVAVLVSGEFAPKVITWLADELADEGADDQLAARIAVFEVDKAKGLEFDAVIVVEPASIISQWGQRALYMACTRCTKQLYVLHSQPFSGRLPSSPDQAA